LAEQEDEQAAVEAEAEKGGNDEGQVGIKDFHVQQLFHGGIDDIPGDNQVLGRDDDGQHHEGENPFGEPVGIPAQTVPDEGAGHHVAQGAQQGDNEAVQAGEGHLQGLKGQGVIARRQHLREPFDRGVHDVVIAHQGPGDHEQERIQEHEAQHDEKKVQRRPAGQPQAVLAQGVFPGSPGGVRLEIRPIHRGPPCRWWHIQAHPFSAVGKRRAQTEEAGRFSPP